MRFIDAVESILIKLRRLIRTILRIVVLNLRHDSGIRRNPHNQALDDLADPNHPLHNMILHHQVDLLF